MATIDPFTGPINPLAVTPPKLPKVGPSNMFDPTGLQGALAVGRRVYGGASMAPPGAGRPRDPAPMFTPGGTVTPAMMQAVQERLRGYTDRTQRRNQYRTY